MSTEQTARLDTIDNARLVLDQWIASLAQVLESMTDQRPEIHWKALSEPIAELEAPQDASAPTETLWWEQPFRLAPEMLVWVATPRATWEYTGTLTLKSAGLETIERNEARNTWIEILSQSLAAVASAIGNALTRDVTCDTGAERIPSSDPGQWASVQISLRDVALAPLLVTFSPQLREALASPPSPAEPACADEDPVDAAGQPPESPATSRTMDLLMDVELPVSISFGKAQLLLKDVVKLTTGSIIELNRSVNERVEVLVNQCLIARGEVVVVEGNYGVRILEIASRQERLRTLQ